MDGAGGCGGGSEISDEELGTESEFEPKRRKLAPSSPISDVEKENEDDEIRSEVGEESGSSPEEVAAALSHVRGGSQSPPRILSQGQGGSRFPHGTPRSRMRQLSPPAAPEGGLGLSSASSSPLCRDKDTARRHLGDYDDDEPKADDEGENDGEQEAPHHGGDMNATTSLISRSSVFSSKKAYLNDERDEDEIMEQEMKAHLRSAPALSCTDRQRDADELSKNASVRDTDKDQQVKSNISDDHHDEDAVFKSEDLRKGSCHVEDHRTDAPSKSCRGSTFSTTSSVNMPARRNSNNKASSTSKAAVAERATNCSSGASSSSSSSRKKQPSMCGSKAETAGPQAPSLRIQEPTSASGVGILHARTTTLLSPGLMNGRASGPLVKKADTIEEAYIMSLPCADDEDDEGRIGSPTTFRPAPAKGQGIEPSCSSMDLTAGRAEAAAANRTSGQQKPVTETTSRTALSGGGVSFAPAAATTIDAQASPQEAKSTFFGSSSSTSTSSSGASSTLGAVGGLFNRIWNWAFPVVGRKRQRAEDAAPDEQPSSWTTGDAASSSAQRADNENFLASATSRASSSLVVQPSTSLMDIDADESGKAAMIIADDCSAEERSAKKRRIGSASTDKNLAQPKLLESPTPASSSTRIPNPFKAARRSRGASPGPQYFSPMKTMEEVRRHHAASRKSFDGSPLDDLRGARFTLTISREAEQTALLQEQPYEVFAETDRVEELYVWAKNVAGTEDFDLLVAPKISPPLEKENTKTAAPSSLNARLVSHKKEAREATLQDIGIAERQTIQLRLHNKQY